MLLFQNYNFNILICILKIKWNNSFLNQLFLYAFDVKLYIAVYETILLIFEYFYFKIIIFILTIKWNNPFTWNQLFPICFSCEAVYENIYK